MSKKMRVVRASGSRLLGEALEDLEVPLTPQELLVYGRELAVLRDKELELEGEMETAKSAFKKRTWELSARRTGLSRAIRDKRELRPVRVESWARYDEGKLEQLRTDTGEIIGERPLLPHELQEELPLETGDARGG